MRPAPSSLTAALLLAAAPLLAQEQRFTDTTSITTIEVPVTVELAGRAVTGLTVDDFEVYDEGQRVKITGFEEVRVDAAASTNPGRDPWRARTLVFLLDFAWSHPYRLEESLDALADVFARENLLGPGDRVGLVGWSATRGLLTFLEPTANRLELAYSIVLARAVAESDPQATGDALALLPARDAERLLAESRLSGFNRNSTFFPVGPATEQFADDVSGLFERATYPGAKILVHLSSGLSDDYLVAGDFERPRVLGNLERILVAGRRTGWAIHSVNLSGLGFGTDTQLMLAKDTGGRLHTNSNDLALLVEEAERSTRSFYLLAFEPQTTGGSHGFRQLKVKVRSAPAGTHVRHRWGYQNAE